MPREIHDNRFANSLAGKRAATAARQNRHTVSACRLMDSDHIIGAAREGDGNRHDLIVAGIGAVEDTGHLVGRRLVFADGGLEVAQQVVDLHGRAF